MNYTHLTRILDQHNGIIIFSLDHEYRYTFFTQSHRAIMKKIWGADIKLGDNMLEYIASPDKEKAKANFDRALAGEEFSMLEEYGDKELYRTWWEDRYSPIKNEQSIITGLSVFVIDMTQMVETSRHLTEAQERLKLALRSSNTGIWEWNVHTHEITWSEEVYSLFNVDPKTFKPDINNYFNLIYPEDRPRVQATIQEVLTNQTPYKIEHRIIDSQGNIRWVFGSGSVYFDEMKRPHRLIGVVRDVTERVLNLERLSESEAKFRSVVDNNPMGILVYELNSRNQLILIQINSSAAQILKIQPESIIGLPIEKAFPGLAGTDLPQHYYNVLLHNTTWYSEEVNYEADHIHGTFQVHAFPIGKNRLAVFFLNISDKKTKEKELANWRLRYELLVKVCGQMIYDYNVSSGHIEWFGETERILGFTNAEMGDINLWAERLHPDDRETILSELSRCQNQLEKFDVVYRFATRNGEYRYLSDRGYFFQDEFSKSIRMLGIMEDISSKKITELELKHKNEELVKINQELDRFVYSASHDLRAPIASLLGLIRVARLEKVTDNLDNLFRLQEKSLARMDRFINDIVNYSRNSRVEITLKPIDLQQLIHECLEQLGYLENTHRIRKEIVVDSTHTFYSDPDRLRMIFNNLLSNAIKYTDLLKPDPYITITAKITEIEAQIAIQDNGEGIPAEAREKVFDMFYRASLSKSGSGLGLYIVKEVVEKLGGSITLHSEYEKGTAITIRLPNRTV